MSRASITLTGSLGRDAEIITTPNGFVMTFSVATNARRKNRDGNWEDVTTWWDAVAFGKNQSYVENKFIKGALVRVDGEVYADVWVSREGEKRTSLKVMANFFEVIGKSADRQAPTIQQAKPKPEKKDDFGDVPF